MDENKEVREWYEQGGPKVDAYFEDQMYPNGRPNEAIVEVMPLPDLQAMQDELKSEESEEESEEEVEVIED